MDKQDIKQHGINWLVEEIGRLKVLAEQQRTEIQADNEHMRELHAALDMKQLLINELQQNAAKADNNNGFPRIITTPETTLIDFVRQLDYMIGWIDRCMYSVHTTGVMDIDMPALINSLRNLAGDTRKLYHKLENQLTADKQAQQATTSSSGQQAWADMWKALYNANVDVDESNDIAMNAMVARNENGEVVWVMYW